MQYLQHPGQMIRRIFQLLFFFLITVSVSAQKYETKSFTEAGYTYQAVEGDPTETRIYTLKNGMKVYLSVYRDLPQSTQPPFDIFSPDSAGISLSSKKRIIMIKN